MYFLYPFYEVEWRTGKRLTCWLTIITAHGLSQHHLQIYCRPLSVNFLREIDRGGPRNARAQIGGVFFFLLKKTTQSASIAMSVIQPLSIIMLALLCFGLKGEVAIVIGQQVRAT